jgi:epoxyqueuosine reductase
MGNSTKNSILLKKEAQRLGFDFCGIAKAEFLEEEAPRLENWLNQGMHGKMSYMENHFDKRLDPCKLVPGAKSVITLIYNYFPKRDLGKNNSVDHTLKIAKYAYGEDYHFVIKRKLKELLSQLENQIGGIQGRVFVDSAPVLERVWAQRSGLGWIGKNSLLLNRSLGSFFFLAEMILDIEFEYDGPVKDYCGTCTRCMDACPTDAISKPYVVDASKCISYLTIELKEQIPEEFKGKMENWAFGCDICQDVCPWNRFSKQHSEPAFDPSKELQQISDDNWVDMSKDVFNKVFKKSAVKRTKFEGMQRNVTFLRDNQDKRDS